MIIPSKYFPCQYVTSDGVSRYPICSDAVIRRLYNGDFLPFPHYALRIAHYKLDFIGLLM